MRAATGIIIPSALCLYLLISTPFLDPLRCLVVTNLSSISHALNYYLSLSLSFVYVMCVCVHIRVSVCLRVCG